MTGFDDSQYGGQWLDEHCPLCSAQLLGNTLGDRWCSFIDCSYIRFFNETETDLINLEKQDEQL